MTLSRQKYRTDNGRRDTLCEDCVCVCKCCCAAWHGHGQCGVAALHVTIASPQVHPPSSHPSQHPCAAHTTYPHRLPQLARRQSHFTPTKLRKWQANEPSNAIFLFFCCFSFKFFAAGVFVVVVLTLDAQ